MKRPARATSASRMASRRASASPSSSRRATARWCSGRSPTSFTASSRSACPRWPSRSAAAGAASTINRIIDAFPTDQQEQIRVQLANNLIAVLSQTLCPRIDQEGRMAAYEFMYVTPGIQNLIRENKSFRIDSEIQTGKKFGMQLLDDNLWMNFGLGKISTEEAIDKSKNHGGIVERRPPAGLVRSS